MKFNQNVKYQDKIYTINHFLSPQGKKRWLYQKGDMVIVENNLQLKAEDLEPLTTSKSELLALGLKEYESLLPPIIVTNLGKRCAILHYPTGISYVEIPPSVSIWDLDQIHLKPEIKIAERDRTWSVPSNTSTKEYTVKRIRGHYSCNCTGFGFKQNCTHIELVQSGKLEEYKQNFQRLKISTGKGYKIVRYNKMTDEYTCSCVGFKKNNTCIHVKKAKQHAK